MPPGSHAEYTTTKIYFCKQWTLKAVAEWYRTAPVLFCGQIFQQQLRVRKGLQPCTAKASEAGNKTARTRRE